MAEEVADDAHVGSTNWRREVLAELINFKVWGEGQREKRGLKVTTGTDLGLGGFRAWLPLVRQRPQL